MSEYEFDAHIVVDREGTKEYAAERILEHCLDADIAISLHEQGSLNVRQLSAEGAVKDAVISAAVTFLRVTELYNKDSTVFLWEQGELIKAIETLNDPVSGSQDSEVLRTESEARREDAILYRRALTEITCCSSIQEAAIIANGALLEFQPITDEDMEWAKNADDSKPTLNEESLRQRRILDKVKLKGSDDQSQEPRGLPMERRLESKCDHEMETTGSGTYCMKPDCDVNWI